MTEENYQSVIEANRKFLEEQRSRIRYDNKTDGIAMIIAGGALIIGGLYVRDLMISGLGVGVAFLGDKTRKSSYNRSYNSARILDFLESINNKGKIVNFKDNLEGIIDKLR